MQHLQPNTTLQGGKYRKLRVSERHKNLFLNVRAEAGYSIERVLGILVSEDSRITKRKVAK